MKVATFVISTGRCGTQWIAETIGGIASDRMVVEHEPLHNAYRPREALSYDHSTLNFPEVSAHLERIDRILGEKDYLECGHPLWSSIPILARHFAGRVRFVHLTRHPVPVSYSWLTHSAFQEPILPHLAPKVLISPFDEGVAFPEYQSRWDAMSPFEKVLYYWGEVNQFAENFHARNDAPWLRLSYEELFKGDGLSRLLSFLWRAKEGDFSDSCKQVHDKFRYCISSLDDWRVIEKHPRVLELAGALGYKMEGLDEGVFDRRYLPNPSMMDD